MKTKTILIIAGVILFLAWRKKNETVFKPIAKSVDASGRQVATEVS